MLIENLNYHVLYMYQHIVVLRLLDEKNHDLCMYKFENVSFTNYLLVAYYRTFDINVEIDGRRRILGDVSLLILYVNILTFIA